MGVTPSLKYCSKLQEIHLPIVLALFHCSVYVCMSGDSERHCATEHTVTVLYGERVINTLLHCIINKTRKLVL